MNQVQTPSFRHFLPKKLVGFQLEMSLTQNRTGELWQQFMKNRHLLPWAKTEDRISMQVYPEEYFSNFKPTTSFTKWAATEVADFENLPEGLDMFEFQGGLYAVFDYKGSSDDTRIFSFIFQDWLPRSGYELDQRPHFEILGLGYKNQDPESEELICIPVKPVS